MTWLNVALLVGLTLAGVAVALLAVLVRRDRARTRAELVRAQAEGQALRDRLDGLERRLDRPEPSEPTEFVITDVGEHREPVATERIEGRLFADIVLRESVVKAAALAHGVRQATSPESRFRIRYAYSREVKQARKRRRLALRRLRRVVAGRRQEREDAA